MHELGQHCRHILPSLQGRVNFAGDAAVLVGLLEGSVAVAADVAEGFGRFGLRPLVEEDDSRAVDDVGLRVGMKEEC